MKKTMKKTIILAAFIGAISISTTYAQNDPPVEKEKTTAMEGKKHGGGMEMFKDLNLTPEQQTKIKGINEEIKTKVQGIKTDATLNEDAKKEKMAALKKEKNKKIFALLTNEQKEKMRAKMKEKGKKGGDGAGGEGGES